MKDLTERRQGASIPGPGQYEPKRLGSSREQYAGQSAFKSHTDRSKISYSEWKETCGDPGEYNVIEIGSLSSKAKWSFQKSNKEGKGTFGGTRERKLRLTNSATIPPKDEMGKYLVDSEPTPGPGTYTPLMTETGFEHDMHIMNGHEKMKSASFASTTKRPEPALPNWKNPSPAEYYPKPAASIEPQQGNMMSKVGRASRYTSDEIDGGAEDSQTGLVGPGAYDPLIDKSGDVASIKIKSSKVVNRSSRYKKTVERSDQLAFNSSGPSRELPFETHHGVASKAEATPEPGKYDPKVTEHGNLLVANADSLSTHNANAKKGTAGFMVSSPASAADLTTKQQPSSWQPVAMMTDPTLYNPTIGREIDFDAKKTSNVKAKKGEGTFGGTRERKLRLTNSATIPPKDEMGKYLVDSEPTPGPGTYTPLMTETGFEHDMHIMNGHEKMKSASFASTTKRPEPALPNWKNPSPAEYYPKPAASIEPQQGNMMSKVGRASRYTSDEIDGGAEDSQTGLVGPGAYTPMRLKSGGMDTIELTVMEQGEFGFGTNASVTSGSFRTMFMQWLGIHAH